MRYRRLLINSVLALGFAAPAIAAGKAGAGSGLPYGTPLLGVGAEVDLGNHVSALGGLGLGSYEAPWAYGLRVSPSPANRRWRPHLSVLRWTEGTAVYAGVDHDVGRPGGMVATYGIGFGDVNLEGRVGMMVGIGHRF